MEGRYQPPDQVSLYRTQLRAKNQDPKESLGEIGDAVERAVRLAYPTLEQMWLTTSEATVSW